MAPPDYYHGLLADSTCKKQNDKCDPSAINRLTVPEEVSPIICVSETARTAALLGELFAPLRTYREMCGSGPRRDWCLGAHNDAISELSFTPDQSEIFSVSLDRTLRFWARKGNPLRTWTPQNSDGLENAIFNPQGSRVLTVDRSHSLRLWDFPSGVERLALNQQVFATNVVAFTENGKYFRTVSSDEYTRLIDPDHRDAPLVSVHAGFAGALAVAPDESRFATSTDVTQVWDRERAMLLHTLRGNKRKRLTNPS
jgi:WD40 repeat protein